MIYDMLDNMKLYSAISPRLRAALEFARNFDATGPEGRFDMDSEDMYGLVAAYDTKDAAELAFESHEKYADVQILLEGSEYIDVSVGEQLAVRQAYSEDTDTALWEAPKWFSTLSMARLMYLAVL